MKVILKEAVEHLGEKGQIVEVKDGYAHNFLIPRGKALRATESNLRVFQEEEHQRQRREQKERRLAETLAERLANISCTITVQVGEDDRVFGSVTAQTIADALKQEGYDIDRRKILLNKPIKALGIYTVPVRLHPEVTGDVRVWVVKE